MIISHKHRYLFVELPNTGSTAVSKELCENYNGAPILHKHAYYHEFLKVAKPEEREFFVFSCIRNPLDVAVTIYFKYKTNHEGIYTNPKLWKKKGGHLPNSRLRRFKYVAENNPDFPTYFKKFYKLPYDNWSNLAHEQFDFVIRYENLQGDFSKLLSLLGLHQKRPLPVVNKTEKKEFFLSYYTPEIHARARRVFGPFLKKWGYDFPPEWGNSYVPWTSQKMFDIISFVKRQFFWGSSSRAQLVKKLVESF